MTSDIVKALMMSSRVVLDPSPVMRGTLMILRYYHLGNSASSTKFLDSDSDLIIRWQRGSGAYDNAIHFIDSNRLHNTVEAVGCKCFV